MTQRGVASTAVLTSLLVLSVCEGGCADLAPEFKTGLDTTPSSPPSLIVFPLKPTPPTPCQPGSQRKALGETSSGQETAEAFFFPERLTSRVQWGLFAVGDQPWHTSAFIAYARAQLAEFPEPGAAAFTVDLSRATVCADTACVTCLSMQPGPLQHRDADTSARAHAHMHMHTGAHRGWGQEACGGVELATTLF